MTVAKSLSKAVYVFSPDLEGNKVAHLNFLPKEVLEQKVLDAKVWLGEVSNVIGGKVSLTVADLGKMLTLVSGWGERGERDWCRN